MEKLRAALDKARQSREERLAVTGGKTTPTAKEPQEPSSSDALWEALAPLNLKDEHLIQRRVVTRLAGKEATPFDILRTKILLQMRKNGWKRLAITSPMPQSGKTTTACNLALGLGRQSDLRSILFDLDLRDPSAHEFFKTQPPCSISDVLTGKAAFKDQALRYGDNVAISMALEADTDPTRILLSEEANLALNEIEAAYQPDIMIFDLPSVLVNDDTRAFLKNADCALIVARADRTQYDQFEACRSEIADLTNVIGVVLNAYRHDKRSFRTK